LEIPVLGKDNGIMAVKKYPAGIKERGVRLVLEAKKLDPADRGAISRIARQLRVGSESLRTWVKQAEVDAGLARGVTTEQSAREKELEREVRELRRANEILKLASAFFARELDPQAPKK
jgi:transposase